MLKTSLLFLAQRFEKLAKLALAAVEDSYSSFLRLLNLTSEQVSLNDFTEWSKANNLENKNWNCISNPGLDKFLISEDGKFLFMLRKESFLLEELEELSGEGVEIDTLSRSIIPYTKGKKCRVIRQSIIQNYKLIPKLFLLKLEITGEVLGHIEAPLIGMSKDLSHHAWLYDALHQMTGCSVDQANQFFDENKEKIINLIKVFFTKTPTYIGSGEDGVVYDIGENMLFKLFLSSFAYQKTKDALRRLHSETRLGRTEANIYDVGILGNGYFAENTYEEVPVYYYIIEKMEPVKNFYESNKELFDAIESIRSEILGCVQADRGLKEIKKMIDQSNPDKVLYKRDIRRKILDIVEEIAQNIYFRNSEEIEIIEPNLGRSNWLDLFIEEVIIKYLTERVDLSMGNLGISAHGKSKTLRFFDPVYDWNTFGESGRSGKPSQDDEEGEEEFSYSDLDF